MNYPIGAVIFREKGERHSLGLIGGAREKMLRMFYRKTLPDDIEPLGYDGTGSSPITWDDVNWGTSRVSADERI